MKTRYHKIDLDIALFNQAARSLLALGFRVGIMYPNKPNLDVRAIALAHNKKALDSLIKNYLNKSGSVAFFERELQ